MKQIIEQILQWPVIVQGALGSALFWLILLCGQKLVDYVSQRLTKYRVQLKQHGLVREHLVRKYFFNQERGGWAVSLCLYQFFHYSIRGVIFVVLGYIFSSIIEVFGIVGFIGGLYYFFRAAGWVKPVEDNLTFLQHWERVAELEVEMFGEVKADTKKQIEGAKKAEQEAASKPAAK